ncbi:unnamed protein product [Larinioides sclopetarius]|uniref:Uncharacterized protein n=1 Tax=Larinioides sclopetarius TaxID=280406 RepID=A0AAV1ZM10_9ARAC
MTDFQRNPESTIRRHTSVSCYCRQESFCWEIRAFSKGLRTNKYQPFDAVRDKYLCRVP